MRKLIVLLAVFAIIFAFTAEAFADAAVYGSARFRTYRISNDKERTAGGVYDDDDTEWRMGHLSRFGVNFQEGDIRGKFEVDARHNATNAGNTVGTAPATNDQGSSRMGGVRLRHLWGEWNFGAGKLMIGQNYPLTDAPISSIGYFSGGLQQFGGFGVTVARMSQLRLTFGNLRIAFLTPVSSTAGLSTYNADVDTTLPKIEARYDLKLDPVALSFIGGYQTIDIINATDQDKDITSFIVGARAKANFGAFYANAQINYRQNGGNYGMWTSVRETAVWNATSNDIEDTTCLGYGLALGYKISDMFTVEGSFMAQKSEDDRTGGDWEDEAQGFGFLVKITPAPGVLIQPEFVVDDRKDITNAGVTTEQGKQTAFGIFWLINFK